MHTQTISTHKIIFFIGFIVAAIITSLFIYRASHKNQPGNHSSYLVFPAGRDIKPFELVNANNTAFTQRQLDGHWTLVFFGFTHCTKVCPTTMAMLKQTYPELHKKHPNLQVVFVSLDPKRDDIKTLMKYTQQFNPEFISVSGKINELRKLQSQLGIYSQIEMTPNSSQYQIQHSSSILLISPQSKWVAMFKYGMSNREFTNAFNASVKNLTA